ncbi:Lactonase, 7-bladed beta-propeller [Granulicella rosea]|uniref:Lactonase, 7-bladed beta-propeller n=1 Tax=Granulicella rosea TaxID=474952 RepID=A0A239E5Q5_9BACT|nr:hypothetical protein [Granulicella rosea]SNS39343.1 Lactonase, 7-bladed beta-propeller [Granulicella rosea]
MKVQGMKRLGTAMAGLAMLALTGCAGFFVSTSSTSTSTTATAGDYVYALNPTTSTLSAYTVGSGTLTAISGSPYTLASTVAPLSVCVSGLNTIVYVGGTGGIYGYLIGTNGALTQISSGAALATAAVARIACSPDGNWLVALDSANAQVDEYQIATSTGLLTSVSSVAYSYTSGLTPSLASIRFSPLAGYVIAALGNAGTAVYTFNTSTGALASAYTINPSTTTINHNAVTVNSTDTMLYIAESGSSAGVLTYTLGTTTVSGSTTPVAAGTAPYSVELSKTNGFLYVGNYGTASTGTPGSISQYSFENSVPTALSPASVSSSGYVVTMARDNSGSYLLAGLGGVTTDLVMYDFSSSTTGTLVSTASQATSSANTGAGLQIATTH